MRLKRLITAFLLGGTCLGLSPGNAAPRSYPTYDQHTQLMSAAASSRRVLKRPPNSSTATWQMPWQIRPIAYGSRSRRERIVEALVRKTGLVRGTRAAVATIGQPLRPARGRNRTVNACRAVVAREAEKFGAREVEAVSAGRERRTASRGFVAPVRFRVTYKTGRTYEVRLTVLRCVVDRKGDLLNAYAAKPRPMTQQARKRYRRVARRG